MTPSPESGRLVFSYLQHRKVIGYLGFALPFALFFGALSEGFQKSFSAYYHTASGDILVGVLCTIGFFLLAYNGYDQKDKIAGDIACIFAVATAWFPVSPFPNPTGVTYWISLIHSVSAGILFLTLAFFSYFLFTKTADGSKAEGKKIIRNRVYRVCGIVMVSAVVFIPVVNLPAVAPYVDHLRPTFFLEAIAVWAFGISWCVKGGALGILAGD